jgi:RHS repeat-associated protein
VAKYTASASGAPATLSAEYMFLGNRMIAIERAGVTEYVHPDRLSTRMLTTGTGLVAETQSHRPFGEDDVSSSGADKHRFTNYERDDAGGDYAINRHYQDNLGRFRQVDPISGFVVDPQSWNSFAYSLNDPINLVDPLGLDEGSQEPPPIKESVDVVAPQDYIPGVLNSVTKFILDLKAFANGCDEKLAAYFSEGVASGAVATSIFGIPSKNFPNPSPLGIFRGDHFLYGKTDSGGPNRNFHLHNNRDRSSSPSRGLYARNDITGGTFGTFGGGENYVHVTFKDGTAITYVHVTVPDEFVNTSRKGVRTLDVAAIRASNQMNAKGWLKFGQIGGPGGDSPEDYHSHIKVFLNGKNVNALESNCFEGLFK